MLSITPIPAFEDNYIWVLRGAGQTCAVVVDPGDAAAVEDYLAIQRIELAAILITHHHADHIGGIKALTQSRSIPVYGPRAEAIAGITHPVGEGNNVDLNCFGLGHLRVLDVPGHTRGHIAYAADGHVFCGDTLFAGGCGRLFEGTPAQMFTSLAKFSAMPPTTPLYCTHEYTLSNLRFALAVEPNNATLQARMFDESEKRTRAIPTVPTNVALERATNPFLRTHVPEVIASVERFCGRSLHSEIDVFAVMREWKNVFR